MRRAGIEVRNNGSQHAFDHGNGTAFRLQPAEVKRDGKKDGLVCVKQMPCWQIPGVAAALDDRFSRASRERLNDDVRVVPPIVAGLRCDRKEHRLSARQHVRPVSDLARSHGDERLWLAPVGGDLLDAIAALAEENRVSLPARPYGREASQIGTAGPPPTLIRLIVLSDQNAMERPSGENTGSTTPSASSVPGIGVASNAASGRR
jgi:hypothetical protein